MVQRVTLLKKLVWMVTLVTVILMLFISWFFQQNVNSIDRKLDNVRTYESK